MSLLSGPVTVKLTVCTEVADQHFASISSVIRVLASSPGITNSLRQAFPDFLDAERGCLFSDLREDRFDLIFAEPVFSKANGTLKLILQPCKRYLEFVAAITAHGDVSCDFDVHGWPTLSLGGEKPSMAELPDARNGDRQGGHA